MWLLWSSMVQGLVSVRVNNQESLCSTLSGSLSLRLQLCRRLLWLLRVLLSGCLCCGQVMSGTIGGLQTGSRGELLVREHHPLLPVLCPCTYHHSLMDHWICGVEHGLTLRHQACPCRLVEDRGGLAREQLIHLCHRRELQGRTEKGEGSSGLTQQPSVLHHHYSTDEAYSHCTCEVCAL